VDHEVAQTLAALERKLAELERELTSIGRSSDSGSSGVRAGDVHSGDARSGEAGFPPVHSTGPGSHTAASPGPAPASGVLVDEAVEQRFSMEVRETPYGEIPAAKEQRQAIDLADLVRFKEKMQSTLQGLIDEYSRLLSLEPPK
jgi:hypothetical protein